MSTVAPPIPVATTGPTHFVGIDWGNTTHHACLTTITGKKARKISFGHSAEGFARFTAWLNQQVDDISLLAVGIETSDHPLVDRLLQMSVSVYAINPKQADRFRDRHSAAGSKDDSKDAFVISDALRTDLHKFQKLVAPSPEQLLIRAASRREADLQDDLLRLTNRLWQEVSSFAPELLSIASVAQEPFMWDLIEMAADPAKAQKLRTAQVGSLLKRYGKRKYVAAEICAVFKAERFQLIPGAMEAVLRNLAALLPQIRVVHAQWKQALAELTDLVEAGDQDTKIIDSMPGAGVEVTAGLISEAAPVLAARNYRALRALAGSAPVSRNSGAVRGVHMRRACNPRLRRIGWSWARSAVTTDPWAKELYLAMRKRGLGYHRALRGVLDRLIARLIACLEDRTLYDPARCLEDKKKQVEIRVNTQHTA